MKPLLLTLLLLLAAGGAWAKSKEAERIANATDAFNQIMAAPDKSIPGDVLARTHCIVIVPGMKKAAFGIGGQHGKGVVACRKASGAWGAPSMMSMTGGSVGFQIGVQSTDVFMLIMNRKGADYLVSNKFEVGGDLSAAAGPVGREATANTDIAFNAEIYTYSRARGAFAGISLKGARVAPDEDGNRALYGKGVSASALLKEGNMSPPADAQPFMNALAKYAGTKK